MNLARMLRQRAEAGRPVRAGLIGAGKFGSMFLAQARTTQGLHLLGVADLSVERAREAMKNTGWDEGTQLTKSLSDALKTGKTAIIDDADALITADGVEVIVDATGNPAAATRHILKAFAHGKHVINVTVEADVLVGPLLAERAKQAGVVYALAYGDQPAIVCEMVDWAEACGYRVVAAGKGTKYLPGYHQSTPDTVWHNFGITAEHARDNGMNAQMFNSFVDGTKSAIEMAAISNATGLMAPRDGLAFPPCGFQDLPFILRPRADGGVLEEKGLVEVVSSHEPDGRPVVNDIRWGVYVVVEAWDNGARGDYTRGCFRDYHLIHDPSRRYAAFYRSYHLVGMELGISILAAALRKEATGVPDGFRSDVVATAKKPLKAGDTLDGEGGYAVYGKIMRAEDSLARRGLPLGLAHGIKLVRAGRARRAGLLGRRRDRGERRRPPAARDGADFRAQGRAQASRRHDRRRRIELHLPPCGGGRPREARSGGGYAANATPRISTPLPNPPPQGGREKMWTRFTAFITFIFLITAPPLCADEAAIAALKAGGHVMIVRHGLTTPGTGDPQELQARRLRYPAEPGRGRPRAVAPARQAPARARHCGRARAFLAMVPGAGDREADRRRRGRDARALRQPLRPPGAARCASA